jgi:tripartite-type tricarboxylate transporter receptor subunit TctC
MPNRDDAHLHHRCRAMPGVPRRNLLALLPTAVLAQPALAQESYPDRPIRVIVPFPPGGSLDVLTRILCEGLQHRLGQPVVVENRPGAGGNIGTDIVAKSPPDGYSLGSVSVGLLSINQFLYSRMPFDADKELTSISLIYDLPNVAVVPAQHNASKTLAEFIAWAKARPQGVTFGSPGVGTSPHLAGALLAARTGYTGVHVPFRGAAQTVPALLSGSVDFAIDNLASYMPVIQEGRMRALAVTSAERWPTLPDVPTMAEAGVPDFMVTSWASFIAPIATPRPVIEKVNAAIRQVAADPAVRQRMLQTGARSLWTTAEEAQARAIRERPMWQEMVRISGARAD